MASVAPDTHQSVLKLTMRAGPQVPVPGNWQPEALPGAWARAVLFTAF